MVCCYVEAQAGEEERGGQIVADKVGEGVAAGDGDGAVEGGPVGEVVRLGRGV